MSEEAPEHDGGLNAKRRPNRIDSEITRGKFEYWKQVISVQMHFNDMCIRTRWFGSLVFATIVVGAAVSLAQYPDAKIALLSARFHVAFFMTVVAALLVAALWYLDQKYYYKMLICSVEHGEQIEPQLRGLIGDFTGPLAITELLTKKVTRGRAQVASRVYYATAMGVVLAMLVVSLIAAPN